MEKNSIPVWIFVFSLLLFPCSAGGEVTNSRLNASSAIQEPVKQNQRIPAVSAENSQGNTTSNSREKNEAVDSREVVVEGIDFKADKFGPERVLIYFNRFYLPKIFAIEGEKPRIVIDIDNVFSWKGKPVVDIDGIFVKKIRTHLNSTDRKLRIVLDLNPSRNYVADQRYFKNENIFSIMISAGTDKKAGTDSEK